MIATEAKQLKVGTVVMWGKDPKDLGTVRKQGTHGVWVDWEMGQRGWIDYRDARRLSVAD